MESSEKIKRKSQTLWVVTELYYPEETSTGYYLTKIAEGLADDFEVKALCGQPNYSARGTIAPKKERHKNVEIFRTWGTTFDKNIIPLRILNMLTLGLSTFIKALFNFKKGDKILVVTTPPSLPFVTAVASLIKGGSYCLLIHDNYPEILIAVKKARGNSFFVNLLNFFNRWLYKYAAKIIVVGRDMRELIEKKTLGLDISIDTIQNWAELEQVEPRKRNENELLKELGLSDKFVFLYAGNMGHPNELKSLIWCAEKLLEKTDIHFLFLGAGVKKKWLESQIKKRNLKNVDILPPKPRSEQIIFLNACDVGLVSLVKKMRGVSMPSRTYNILAAGKPILALTEESSELAKVINEDSVGWYVPPDEKELLLETILKIVNEKEILPDISNNARNAALKKYSLQVALEKYKNSLK